MTVVDVAKPTPLITESEAAAYMGVKPQTLATWRCTKRYPLPFIRVGRRAIRYRLTDIEKFLADRTIRQTTLQL